MLYLDFYDQGKAPTLEVINDIKNKGLDYENMWDAILKGSECRDYIKRDLLTEVPEDLGESLNKWISINEFQLVAEDWEDCLDDVLFQFRHVYNDLIQNMAKNNISETQSSLLKKIGIILDRSIEDDLAKLKAEIKQKEEEKKRKEEEQRKAAAKAERIRKHKDEYSSIVAKAIDMMVTDVDAGIAYINNYKNISEILSDAETSLDDCINTAKSKAEEKRLEQLSNRIFRLEYDVKNAYKKRNNVGYWGLGCLALGLLSLTPSVLFVGACLIGGTYLKHIKAEKVRKELGELIAKRDGVEFDPSVNPYELPIVAKIIKSVKEKNNKK